MIEWTTGSDNKDKGSAFLQRDSHFFGRILSLFAQSLQDLLFYFYCDFDLRISYFGNFKASSRVLDFPRAIR
jgi:hypothetical protein